MTLSGVVSNHKAGESVAIFYRPYPQPNLIQRATILTAAGGAFSFIVAPQVLTTYEASWKGAFSIPTTVQVQPSLSLGRNNGWIVHASAARSFAGRSVQIQRLNVATGQWVTLRKVLLELEVVGSRHADAAEGHQQAARDDVGQPGRRRLPRRDRPDHHLAPGLTRGARGARELSSRAPRSGVRLRPS